MMSVNEDIPEKAPKVEVESQIWKSQCATNELDILQVFNDVNPKPMRENPSEK